jgi:hypothetical protein
MAQNHTDPLAGFGFIEAPELTWREKAQQVAIGLGFIAAVLLVIAPAFLALTHSPAFLALTRMI